MNGEVIKSFLVGLGFSVDETSLGKFNKSVATAALRVTALFATVQAAAAAITYGISSISEDFEKMGYEYRIIAPAINKAIVLRNELLKAYSAAGVNITKTVQASVKLNFSLTKTKFAMEAIYKSVGSRFFDVLTKSSDAFRLKLYQNMPKIQNALERLVKFVLKTFEAITQLGLRLWSILGRVYDFFVMLDKATDGWSTVILGVIAAWKLLNLSFLATPLGMLLAGFVAILALWDDFQTFQEGGKSLFDWTAALPAINAIQEALKYLRTLLDEIFQVVFGIGKALIDVFQGNFKSAIDALKISLEAVVNLFYKLLGFQSGAAGFAKMLGGVGNSIASVFGGGSAQNDLKSGFNQAPPVGSAIQNSQSNQNVNQQTNINVSGGADASAVGKSVAGEQSRVNFDMVRNMKGATR